MSDPNAPATDIAPAAPAPVAAAPAPSPVPTAPTAQPVAAAPAPAPAEVAPATYDFGDTGFDEQSLAEITAHAKAANLTQAQAAAQVQSLAHSVKTINERKAAKTLAASAEALRSDPEYGGAAFEKTISSAQEAARALGGDALLAELDSTGLGNSPVLIKTLARLAKAGLVAPEFVAGGNAQGGEKSLASLFYGDNAGQ